MPTPLLAYYCALILIASIVGGMIPVWFQLTHRGMQFAVSFVSGVMLGIGVLHMLPHAMAEAAVAAGALAAADPSAAVPATTSALNANTIQSVAVWLLAGMLTMFFIERFFSYHHHDVPGDSDQDHVDHDHHAHEHAGHEHNHGAASRNMSWSGAAAGLALHSILNGVALAAAVQHGSHGSLLAGFGTFLVIVLHKPFDAMTISMLMAHGGWSQTWRNTINGLFSLCIPIGVLVFYFGLMSDSNNPGSPTQQWWIACALAFSAGTFLCISLSDLLPELQFHSHDRLQLSVALLLGLAVAQFASKMETMFAHAPHTPQKVGVLDCPIRLQGSPLAPREETVLAQSNGYLMLNSTRYLTSARLANFA
ncbi:MAG TPA: ZIP family metal transporter [Lacipirellulaceae bacterium]|nr:ZIP family metal transporter [Lacipirellulaceae bacterium]